MAGNNNILSMPVYDTPVHEDDIYSMPVYDKPVYDEDIFYELPGLMSKSSPPSVKFDDVAEDKGVVVYDDEEYDEPEGGNCLLGFMFGNVNGVGDLPVEKDIAPEDSISSLKSCVTNGRYISNNLHWLVGLDLSNTSSTTVDTSKINDGNYMTNLAQILLGYYCDVYNRVSLLVVERSWEEPLRIDFLHIRDDLVFAVKDASLDCASVLIGEILIRLRCYFNKDSRTSLFSRRGV